ncbi:MAG: hypothetical protein PHH00_01710 [Candidatus Nanoarchaeia archaeon]|nr:hypothetical protein [Candidatus Nanoarchaeia archaeon]
MTDLSELAEAEASCPDPDLLTAMKICKKRRGQLRELSTKVRGYIQLLEESPRIKYLYVDEDPVANDD